MSFSVPQRNRGLVVIWQRHHGGHGARNQEVRLGGGGPAGSSDRGGGSFTTLIADALFDFDFFFDDDYLYFEGPNLGAKGDGDADLIWRLLALEPETQILDLACGRGRIGNRLAARRSVALTQASSFSAAPERKPPKRA